MRRDAPLLLLGITLTAAGCSISASSISISDSVGSVSGSISESSASSSRSRETDYQNDVRDYTAAYVKSGGRYESFQSELATLARKQGISDWENSKATWVGVGEGLKRGGVTGVAYDTYKQNLTSGDAQKMTWVQSGYDHTK